MLLIKLGSIYILSKILHLFVSLCLLPSSFCCARTILSTSLIELLDTRCCCRACMCLSGVKTSIPAFTSLILHILRQNREKVIKVVKVMVVVIIDYSWSVWWTLSLIVTNSVRAILIITVILILPFIASSLLFSQTRLRNIIHLMVS